MSQHTPGPWYVTGDNIHAGYTTPGGDRVDRWVATISAGQNDKPRMVDYANARLIAAAPDLLAALERASTFIASSGCAGSTHMVSICETAITKAKGE